MSRNDSNFESKLFNKKRRRFVQGMTVGSVAIGLGIIPESIMAAVQQNTPQTLKGTNFDLTIGEQAVNITGVNRPATTVNGSLPAPTLYFQEGDDVTLNVKNALSVDSSIHWHGLILPSAMDGVPHISEGFKGIKPGETFTYKFPVIQSGTYWYHSHSGFQEQTGVYGAIVIEPKKTDPFSYDKDYVVMLSDWSDEKPENVYGKLKKLSHYYNFRERTAGDLYDDIRKDGWAMTWSKRGMWNDMRMSDRDISDVTGYTYTFLMNGQNPATGWTGLFNPGEKIRLRFINSAAMTFFDVRIPGLKMTVVAADGQLVKPVSIDEFRIGVAETYDVIVEPEDNKAYTVFAQAIDRSGYARGTLTPDPQMKAMIPAMDAAPLLGHKDMGMDMSGGAHAGHDMSAMSKSPAVPEMKCGGNMDMSGGDKRSDGGMTFSEHAVDKAGKAGYGSAREIVHADTEYGPHVDMRSDAPAYRLDEAGIGLENNGRKVLTYADLRNYYPTPDKREPSREIDIHLTGNMSRYMWSMNGVKFADAEPIKLKFGERVRFNLVNDTMMNHPIHLHGMWSDLETGDPDFIPRKHTIIVPPGGKASYLVTADAKGGWAYHCHLMYHMMGMFRKVEVV
ncbi:MAG: copper resistance system multicopper oxidase [Gammaproteobacteria bacterium]|nr:copper resistance system multicopper oxidase [Gammaproteobacteria bacterium]